MKKIATIILTCVIGLSMTMAPTLMYENAYADDTQEPAADVTAQANDEVASEEAVTEEAPAEDAESEPADLSDVSYDNLDGCKLTDVENDPELCSLLEDPTFYRYYEVDDDGIIHD